MKKLFMLAFILLMPVQGIGQTLELTSVSPNRGVPGTPVRVTGGPFSSGAQVFFGAQLAATVDVRAGALTVIVPPLQPGSYALSVQDGNEAAWQSYTFEVLEPSPLISSISPRNIDACSDSGERRILVEGRHFLPGSALLLDGAAVAVRDRGRSRLEFDLPRGLQAGVYGVQVRNPGGASSLPHSLWVNNIPEIFQVELGNEYVNHYEVIIRGRNFYYNSVVSG